MLPAPNPRGGRKLLVLSLCLSVGLSPLFSAEIQNPVFADADGDKTPDGWNPYPPGDGTTRILAPAPGGGLVFKDDDKNEGLGLEQWVPVEAGQRYTASATVTGTGAVNLMLIFAKEKPAQAAALKNVKLLEKSVRAAAGSTSEVIGIAPAGARMMKVWLYCPKIGVTDVVVNKLELKTDTPPASEVPAPAAVAPAQVSAPGAPSGPVPAGNLLKNSNFSDADGDTTPDNWNPYPPANGQALVLASSPDGGLVFKDGDKENGLGLEQWIEVQEGLNYTASATATGTGGVNLTMIFAKVKPQRPGDLKSVQLAEKSARAAGGKPATVSAVAPPGAKMMKFWLYCPKIGEADVVIKDVSLTASAGSASAAAAASKPPSPLPPGLAMVMDFETGDFSQAHATEGGENLLVKSGEGPVREGKYAFKSALKLDKHRAECAGQRSNASGVARYGWSMYLPEEFDAFTHFSIVTQWHSWDTKPESPKDGGPPTSITISKGKMNLKLLHQGDDGWTSKATYLPIGSIEDMRGKWTDFVMEVNWQGPGKGGWLKLYKNDELVIDHKGTTWYEGKDKGPYFKFGNYKGSTQWKGTEEGAVIYFDSGRMALGDSSTYKMVAPSAYSPRPLK